MKINECKIINEYENVKNYFLNYHNNKELNEKNIKSFNEKYGVYGLYINTILVYIGQSGAYHPRTTKDEHNLYKRLKQYLKNKDTGDRTFKKGYYYAHQKLSSAQDHVQKYNKIYFKVCIIKNRFIIKSLEEYLVTEIENNNFDLYNSLAKKIDIDKNDNFHFKK